MRAPQIGFDQLVQAFFVRRLINQRGASTRTVESYRDAFELLFGFIEGRTGKSPSALSMADLDAPTILDFLDHLETERHNSARTRNARLAAIHSFMRYAAMRDPASLAITTRVLAIPAKRFDRPVLGYLTRDEVAAILAAPDRRTWSGQRDAVLLAIAYNTGARVSELTGLRVRDVLVDRQNAVHLHGKGRKQRVIPLWTNTAAELRAWLDRISPAPEAPVFPNRAGAALTRSGSATASTVPSPSPNNAAHRCAAGRCHPTPCGTRPLSTCWSQGPIWLSSPCGWDIPAPPSPINILKPTSPPKKLRSGAWPIQARRQPGSDQATGSWPSWNTSDYVQSADPNTTMKTMHSQLSCT